MKPVKFGVDVNQGLRVTVRKDGSATWSCETAMSAAQVLGEIAERILVLRQEISRLRAAREVVRRYADSPEKVNGKEPADDDPLTR